MTLNATTKFQFRLGWLERICALKQSNALDNDALGKALLREAQHKQDAESPEAQDLWFQRAKLTEPPQGRLSERAVQDLLRMAEVYGLYARKEERLTDMGHLVALLACADPADSMAWRTPERRFLGLRLFLEAHGLLALALLDRWPASGIFGFEEACDALKSLARDLLLAREMWSEAQRTYLERFDKLSAYRLREDVLYPLWEPLRDLGYVERAHDHRTAYRLTPLGGRLKDAMGHASRLASLPSLELVDVPRLLACELARCFLLAETGHPPDDLGPLALLEALEELPDDLRVSESEAPLLPAVLLAQYRALERAHFSAMEPEGALAWIASVERSHPDTLVRKSGTYIYEHNVKWYRPLEEVRRAIFNSQHPVPTAGAELLLKMAGVDPEVRRSIFGSQHPIGLASRALLSLSYPFRPRAMAAASTPLPSDPTSDPNAVQTALDWGASSGQSAPETLTHEEPAPETPTSEASTSEASTPETSTPATPTPEAPAPETPTTEAPTLPETTSHLRHTGPPAHVLFWLQLFQRLVDPSDPMLHATRRYGGPCSWARALWEHLQQPKRLAAKREVEGPTSDGVPPSPYNAPLRGWLDGVLLPEGQLPFIPKSTSQDPLRAAWDRFRRLLDPLVSACLGWTHQPTKREALGRLLKPVWETNSDALHACACDLLEHVLVLDSFDAECFGWLAELTRGLLDDEILAGRWTREDLHRRFHRALRLDGAQPWFALLQDLRGGGRELVEWCWSAPVTPPSWFRAQTASAWEDLSLGEGATLSLIFPSAEMESELLASATVSLSFRARSRWEAERLAQDLWREARSRLEFQAHLVPRSHMEAWSWDEDASVFRADGLDDPEQDPLPKFANEDDPRLPPPSFFSLSLARQPSADPALLKLPSLKGPTSGVGRSLASALHWLLLAREPKLTHTQRLSHAWVAAEHLFVDEGQEIGDEVAKRIARLGLLASWHARILHACEEVLLGLHRLAHRLDLRPQVRHHVERWMGPEAWLHYEPRLTGVPTSNWPQGAHSFSPHRALELFMVPDADLEALQDLLRDAEPMAYWCLKEVQALLATQAPPKKDKTSTDHNSPLRLTVLREERELRGLVLRVYQLRNRVFHEGEPFAFDHGSQLEDLYVRFRTLISALLQSLLARGVDPARSLAEHWDSLQAPLEPLWQRLCLEHPAKQTEARCTLAELLRDALCALLVEPERAHLP